MPQYIRDLWNLLEQEFTVRYYEERVGDTLYLDCLILNGFCIKIDRLPVDKLSAKNMNILVNSVRDIYVVLNQEMEKLGWNI